MQIEKSISVFLNYCRSKQLRPKTIRSYEQGLMLFSRWLRVSEGVDLVEQIYEMTLRDYVLYMQERGKYTDRVDDRSERINRPANRRDYREQISNTTINNYLRAIRVWCNWLVEQEVLEKSPMRRIKLLKQQRKPKEFLTDDEVKELMSCIIPPVKDTTRFRVHIFQREYKGFPTRKPPVFVSGIQAGFLFATAYRFRFSIVSNSF